MKIERESLADLCHEQWRGWMQYLFANGKLNQDGSFTIPVELADRWSRQAGTLYDNLPGKEKESDRSEADKFIEFFEAVINDDKELIALRKCRDAALKVRDIRIEEDAKALAKTILYAQKCMALQEELEK